MKHMLIGRGQNGWHSDGLSNGNKCSSSGGSLESYLKEADDGTPIYDAKDADIGDFIDWVYKGPMPNPSLDPDQIDSFRKGDQQTLLGMLPALGGAFKAIGVMALSEISSMDFVGINVYLQGLREKVRGVKIGKVQNHQIVWDE